ncbi:unnamed protein product [Mytilus edulis]|uniref:C1q domain-containing protein n=1 Tax=Mytilus edulis TaxID=6550 RepID=A0A8S3UB03_MYTED|nr:unnamed protein product [Mytilus edulis]
MRTVSSSIGSESESLLTCSKFHFEEKVLEKLVRLEHKVEIYEETIKKFENLFVSIAVTAYVSSAQTFSGGVVKFPTVYLNLGIKDIETFKTSEKFVCEFSGLYYISSHLRTKTQNNAFYVKKNGVYIAFSATDDENHYSTNPISAVVELHLHDTLHVQASSINIDSTYSCLSIVKIK